jgi:hypothetical protein
VIGLLGSGGGEQLIWSMHCIVYMPGLVNVCAGVDKVEVLFTPELGSPKFHSMNDSIGRLALLLNLMGFCTQVSGVKRISRNGGGAHDTIFTVLNSVSMPQLKLTIAITE